MKTEELNTYSTCFDSPIGAVTVTANERGILSLSFSKSSADDDFTVLTEAKKQLCEYFNGKRREFSLPLDLRGTPFQLKVWRQLLTVPYGKTVSYGEIARGIGEPKACRAVGGANNKNPVAIIVPCHRVIGANGSLTGYAGGLEIKKFLLTLEAANL